ncbi:UNVERIFIED_CONTAM: hypothetical protein Slati_2745200 [Sesamum latifolium]|uniref:Uncharacterized protein n=1 Tax=Sesamum latifolium TaxID=2727402 RepID=A0AAW2VWL0_9LAMI
MEVEMVVLGEEKGAEAGRGLDFWWNPGGRREGAGVSSSANEGGIEKREEGDEGMLVKESVWPGNAAEA